MFAALALSVVPSRTPAAEPVRSEPTESGQSSRFACGLTALDTALRTVGGEAAVSGIRQLGFRASGDSNNAYQGYRAASIDTPERDGRFTVLGEFDFAGGRYWQENEQSLRGGLVLRFATISTGTRVANLRMAERSFAQADQPSAETAAAQTYDFPARFLPPLLLRRARENLPSVRCADADHRTFEFNWDARTRYALRLDGAGLVSELRQLQPDLVDGQTEVTIAFEGRQSVGGIVFPQRARVIRRNAAFFALALSDLRVNETADESRFRVPEGFTEIKSPPGLWSEKIAPGVWEVRGAGGGTYRTQVFEASDYLVVFDAPLQPSVTRQMLAHIREKIGQKPVRYVVLSHFHGDHSGGLATYADLGATLLTTPADAAVVRRVLAARNRLQPPLAAAPAKTAAAIETVEDAFELKDGERVLLRVLRIEGSPHVAEILVAYQPDRRILAQADLYSTLTPFNDTYAFFADWLRRTRLPAETILGVHHDPIGRDAFLALAKAYRTRQPDAGRTPHRAQADEHGH